MGWNSENSEILGIPYYKFWKLKFHSWNLVIFLLFDKFLVKFWTIFNLNANFSPIFDRIYAQFQISQNF